MSLIFKWLGFLVFGFVIILETRAGDLVQCQRVKNKLNEERLLCPEKSILLKRTTVVDETVVEKFVMDSSKKWEIGEATESRDSMKCKEVYFDGVKYIYCQGKLYTQNFNQYFSQVELNEFNSNKREFKAREYDYTNTTNSGTSGISR